MKNLLLTLIILISLLLSAKAVEQDTLWFRDTGSLIHDIDFTPNDESIIIWNSEIQFWNVPDGTKEFTISTESNGNFNFDNQFLVFSQNNTPKLLNWISKEVIEGFEKESYNLGSIRTARSRNEFMSKLNLNDSTLYFWDIDNKRKVDSFSIKSTFKINDIYWERKIIDFDYIGNNDEYFYITIEDNNHTAQNLPLNERKINTSNLFFSRFQKEFIDSVFRSTFENSNPIYIYNYISVLNNRNKAIMNISGGKIVLYDIETKKIIDEYIFSNDSAIVNDIYTSNDDNIIAIASDRNAKIIDFKQKEVLQSYDFEIMHFALGNISNLIVAGGKEYISLRPKSWVKSNIQNEIQRDHLRIEQSIQNEQIDIILNLVTTSEYSLSVVDLSGNILELIEHGVSNLKNKIIPFKTDSLAKGVYFVKLEYNNKNITAKFIKE